MAAMKLPNHASAILPREKIVDYLLSATHREGRGKAEFFSRFGFSADSWEEFAEALRQHAAEHDVKRVEPSPFGSRYIIEGTLVTPSRRTPVIRSVWFVEGGEDQPRFVTAYPVRRKEAQDA
jgi:hypothetical protein